MSTLALYCGGLMEACWLAALAVVPNLCNRYSTTSFGPDKLVFLRCLSLLALAAWIVRRVDQLSANPGARGPAPISGRSPLALALAVLALAYVVSTTFSIWPSVSFWGAYETGQGTYTFFSFVVLAAAVAFNLRTVPQRDRLVTTAIMASFPVAWYGIFQRLGWDPLGWIVAYKSQQERITSLVGHPTFLAAYLVLIFPMVLWRILQQLQAGPEEDTTAVARGRTPRIINVVGYAFLAVVQLVAIILTESRGPLLGLLASVLFMFLLLGVYWNRRSLVASATVAVGSVLAFLVVLNIPNGPLEGLRSAPILKRFSTAFLSQEDTGRFRAELWREAPGLLLATTPLLQPNGKTDRAQALRPWIGYGPETLAGVLAQRYSVPGNKATLENRFHNLVWDLWAGLGGLGAAAFLAVFTLLFYCAYRRLELITTARSQAVFWFLVPGAAMGGALGLGWWQGRGFAGLGLQLGLVGGYLAYPLIAVAAGWSTASSLRPNNSTVGLLVGLLAALVGHLTETAFAFVVPETGLLFWLYAGALAALIFTADPGGGPLAGQPAPIPSRTVENLARQQKSTNRPEPPSPSNSESSKLPAYQEALLPAIIASLILISLVNLFLLRYSSKPLSALGVLTEALTPATGAGPTNWSILGLLAGTWIVSVGALTGKEFRNGKSSRWLPVFGNALLGSGFLVGVSTYLIAQQLAAVGPLPTDATAPELLLKQAVRYETLYLTFVAITFGLIFLGGMARSDQALDASLRSSKTGLAVGLVALAGVVVACYILNLRPVLGEISSRWAEVLQSQKVWPGFVSVSARAVDSQPGNYVYRSKLAQGLADLAEMAPDEPAFQSLISQAVAVLKESQRLPGYNRSRWHLGRAHLIWAAREKEAGRKLEAARLAGDALEQALLWEPRNPLIWCDLAQVDLFFLGQEAAGLERNEKALAIDPRCEEAYALYGEFFTRKGRESPNEEERKQFNQRAIAALEAAVRSSQTPFDYQIALGNLRLRSGELNQALQWYRRGATEASAEQRWRAEAALAGALLELKDQPNALRHVLLAIAKAPPDKVPILTQLRKQIEAMP